LDSGEATVLLGSFGGVTSPARADHPLVGADLTLAPAIEVPADPVFEYAVFPLDRPVRVADTIVDPGSLALVPPGASSLRLAVASGHGRALLLGGKPLGETIQMWWNFVARTRDEITDAWRSWQQHDTDRFGPVPSTLARIDAPTPPWVRR
jgi:redox-sensitive bicupin YhaK (pirin superfamily)